MKILESISRGSQKWGFIAALTVLVIGCVPSDSYELEPPAITPVDQFFVANNNGVPTIPADWHLTVDGAVSSPLTLTLNTLMNYSAATKMATLVCFFDPFFPQTLAGNANWTGVPLHDLLNEAGPLSGAQSVIFHCIDGYRASFSLADLLTREDDLLAYSMNGVTLPLLQGYPLRLVLPGNIGTYWMQWLERIEVSTAAPQKVFFPIPLHAQFLSPRNGDRIAAGTRIVSGMAVVGEGREITGVDVSFDGGATWAPAQLLSTFVPNAWKMWEFRWEASEGNYVISARARDNSGNQQGSGGAFNIANLSISVTTVSDHDGDGLTGALDNCPDQYNPAQEDSYPPQSNGVGNACECEGNFNGDQNVDGLDAATFKAYYGRSSIGRPCTTADPCNGDFSCNGNVDGLDAALFKQDFGRSALTNPCPAITTMPWCIYQLPATHFLGQSWLNKTSPDFHGLSQLSCTDCHSAATECYACHFGPTGSTSPPGWTHGTFPHGSVTEHAPVCNACHDLNRTYGHEPSGCHDCHL
jgi:DMSO/TMAO reductase YedYZ molybdopterin-dependent catalytic subunit